MARVLRSWVVSTVALLAAGCGGPSGGAAGSPPALQQVVALAAPPTYLGTVDDAGGCAHRYATTGFRPAGSDPHPLFLYFVGTDFSNQTETYTTAAPVDVLKAMAARGYVALSVQYDNSPAAWLSDHKALVQCIFGGPAGLLASACNPEMGVDCAQGVVTWGHSLGGAVAVLAASVDRRVRAAWATGITGVTGSALPANRLRVVNGSGDALAGVYANNDPAKLDAQTGVSAADCPSQQDQCLRPDGSGWILVQPDELTPVRTADHCWFDALSCQAGAERVEPNFATGDSRISIASNADWLVRAAATGW